MTSFLLRVEGVNQANFITDTQDLSTVRGAGLLLLNAAEVVEPMLAQLGCNSSAIIQGASIGLFRVHSSPLAAQNVRKEVATRLSRRLPHATFVVDVDETTDEDPIPRATLLARNRWRQMQAPTVVYPSLHSPLRQKEPCEIDKVRPATHYQDKAPDGKRLQSASTRQRREFGRLMKQRFYAREMRRAGATGQSVLRYTADFDDLCGNSPQWGNLRDKMAVLHLDGNKFTAFATNPDLGRETALRDFSHGLRHEQARILRELIEKISGDVEKRIGDDPDWMNNGKIRLETLLWGGDEITWVVPAWKGWELLQFFYQQCGAFEQPDDKSNPSWNPNPDPLTYTAGLVFCHKKAPIHSITALARDLVSRAKQATNIEKEGEGKKRDGEGANKAGPNRFLYQVLESFDYIETVDEGYDPLVLPADAMGTITRAMPAWRASISRKQLHRLLKNPATASDVAQEIKKELQRAQIPEVPVALEAINALEQATLERNEGDTKVGEAAWRHIGELWDYVAPEKLGATPGRGNA